eukprot:1677372-Pyramimonas_sp.AAC.1
MAVQCYGRTLGWDPRPTKQGLAAFFPLTLGQSNSLQRSIEVPIRDLDHHRCAAIISNRMRASKMIGILAHPKVAGLLRDGAACRQLVHRR